MKRYYIESVKSGIGEGGMACGPVSGPVVAEAKIKTDLGEVFYLSLAEVMGIPNFYKTEKSIYDILVNEDDDAIEAIQEKFVDTGDYNDIFKKQDEEWYQLYRFLIFIVRVDWEEFEKYNDAKVDKYIDEMYIPASDVEEEYLEENGGFEDFEFELPDNKEELYRLRLTLEADINFESVFHDMDYEEFEMEKKQLEVVIAACESEEEYLTWKTEYVDSEFERVGDQKYIVCKYMFAGIGQYEMIMPAEGLESFKCWIDGNGSAFFLGEREALANEIKTFIALNAANEK